MNIYFPIIVLLIIISLSNSTLLFKIKNTEPQCLRGEFNEKSVLVVKYKIFTHTRKDLSKIFPYLSIYLHNVKTNKKISKQNIFLNKGKFTFNTEESGLYEVCIQTQRYSVISDLNEDLFVSLKINPDYNDDESLITDPINTKDVDYINQKTRKALSLTKPIIESQKNQLDDENDFALSTLANTNFYRYLTYIQISITFIIGIVQICNFKRFLKSQHVI